MRVSRTAGSTKRFGSHDPEGVGTVSDLACSHSMPGPSRRSRNWPQPQTMLGPFFWGQGAGRDKCQWIIQLESKQCLQRVTGLTHCPHRRALINWSRFMRTVSSPKLSPSEFEPGLISMLRAFLDEAVRRIHVANRTPATKAKMSAMVAAMQISTTTPRPM
jgi:hypothetical protein